MVPENKGKTFSLGYLTNNPLIDKELKKTFETKKKILVLASVKWRGVLSVNEQFPLFYVCVFSVGVQSCTSAYFPSAQLPVLCLLPTFF